MLGVILRKQAPKTSAIWENHGKHTCDCASEPAPDGPTAAASPWSHGPAVPTETSSKCGCDGNPWPSALELCASPLAETQKTLISPFLNICVKISYLYCFKVKLRVGGTLLFDIHPISYQ